MLLIRNTQVLKSPMTVRSRPSCTPKSQKTSKPSPIPGFWSSRSAWKRAAVNTTRCLVGCTIGDFSAMWYLQSAHPQLGITAIMALSMAGGVTTSLLLETTLLRYGRDRLAWRAAAQTAAGMSMISMLTMEVAENMVDYHLMGGAVQFDSPSFWAAALVSTVAGFLAPLPYNYYKLRRFGKACH
ncbi:uncharacterized protein F5Z01DRAFT_681438 [Emericellopsis atlantica]|uniref:DUF4396 domain-containing protein n=1 Tax=Emericellopsis atlantica TaxID=2614577 RepID=A0A9P7ZMV3_9HYPO|nr:uncharacterized protein F5Z01DRAFT_681438 [Emericellopsis atlantica]KAG9254388.1 hypothetical protein F5Z01DRAFT_681438 [Emericellopsis atlantica]